MIFYQFSLGRYTVEHEIVTERTPSQSVFPVNKSSKPKPTDDARLPPAHTNTHQDENSGYDEARDPENADLEFKESKVISYDSHRRDSGYDSNPRKA